MRDKTHYVGDDCPGGHCHDPTCACAHCEQDAHERVTQEFERRREPRECSICRERHGLEIVHAGE